VIRLEKRKVTKKPKNYTGKRQANVYGPYKAAVIRAGDTEKVKMTCITDADERRYKLIR